LKHINNVIIVGGVGSEQSIPYKIMTLSRFNCFDRHILPWYEGDTSGQEFIKSCLTGEQFLESQLCQFPRKPKEVIVESQVNKAYNALINILFKPTMIDDQPDMVINTNYGTPEEFATKLTQFKNQYLTPWMFKIGEINEKSEVEIVEEIDPISGRRIFKINVGNIPEERVAEILEKVKSDITHTLE
jgi:hypothetical protein